MREIDAVVEEDDVEDVAGGVVEDVAVDDNLAIDVEEDSLEQDSAPG